ncbi:class I SAM-dependent methyltransferase [Brachyspira sp.]|uniref:class I SAM-dependent methyltransferase n=1 Tax=Brachyspira sp. TaxID=1977261 RepID=UPI0026120B40|nr:class I SAM-dependent methyltransferase [Brachyspira sp.]
MYKLIVDIIARIIFVRKYRENFLKSALNKEKYKYKCNVCGNMAVFLMAGSNPLSNKKCSICGSTERNRLLYMALQNFYLNDKLDKKIKLLHTAPEECIYKYLSKNKNIEYYPTDISPYLYPNVPCIEADVTNLPFENNFFDLIISSHVIEHIEDENKILSEFNRVLKDDGLIFLSFPYSPQYKKTFEDASVNTPKTSLDQTLYMSLKFSLKNMLLILRKK